MKLGSLVNIIGGGTPSRKNEEYWGGDIPWISVKDFKSNRINSSLEKITQKGLDNSSTKIIPKGNIIMPTRMALGKVAINEMDTAINQDLKALIIKDANALELKYLLYFLESKSNFIEASGKGATVKGITIDILENLDIEVPSITLQRKIVRALELSQGLIEKRKAQLLALSSLTESLFFEMFGNPINNDRGWDTIQFDKVVVLQRGYDLPTNNRDLTGKVDVYGSNGILSKHSSAKVHGGGIITGRSGSIGNVYYTFEDFWPLNTTLFSKETYGNNIIFLTYLLRGFKLERFNNGTGVPTLNRNLVHCEKIIDVPKELQEKFGDIVLRIEKHKQIMNKSLKQLENTFKALLQRAFKGELFNH
ncbi:restriction endonuclease subunit S [Priestia megaterium]|uniref:restriction endonuclease subunit S n=1 Tax=Priestia megaterium TaxID=1404 RepID=UPI0020D27F95|nr:restriction endonuclease subunit S [Priestia megaterium]